MASLRDRYESVRSSIGNVARSHAVSSDRTLRCKARAHRFGVVWARPAADQAAALEADHELIHRLSGDENAARELRRREPVAFAEHAERGVLGRGDAVRREREVETQPQPALHPLHEIAQSRLGSGFGRSRLTAYQRWTEYQAT